MQIKHDEIDNDEAEKYNTNDTVLLDFMLNDCVLYICHCMLMLKDLVVI